jgi:hypothetical protein
MTHTNERESRSRPAVYRGVSLSAAELERYLQAARKRRAEYVGALLRSGWRALSSLARGARRAPEPRTASAASVTVGKDLCRCPAL